MRGQKQISKCNCFWVELFINILYTNITKSYFMESNWEYKILIINFLCQGWLIFFFFIISFGAYNLYIGKTGIQNIGQPLSSNGHMMPLLIQSPWGKSEKANLKQFAFDGCCHYNPNRDWLFASRKSAMLTKRIIPVR